MKYKRSILIGTIGTMVGLVIFRFCLEAQKYAFFFACFGASIIGMFFLPVYPIILELGVELIFPIGEGMSVGILYAGAQIWGFFITIFNRIFFTDPSDV